MRFLFVFVEVFCVGGIYVEGIFKRTEKKQKVLVEAIYVEGTAYTQTDKQSNRQTDRQRVLLSPIHWPH